MHLSFSLMRVGGTSAAPVHGLSTGKPGYGRPSRDSRLDFNAPTALLHRPKANSDSVPDRGSGIRVVEIISSSYQI